MCDRSSASSDYPGCQVCPTMHIAGLIINHLGMSRSDAASPNFLYREHPFGVLVARHEMSILREGTPLHRFVVRAVSQYSVPRLPTPAHPDMHSGALAPAPQSTMHLHSWLMARSILAASLIAATVPCFLRPEYATRAWTRRSRRGSRPRSARRCWGRV